MKIGKIETSILLNCCGAVVAVTVVVSGVAFLFFSLSFSVIHSLFQCIINFCANDAQSNEKENK